MPSRAIASSSAFPWIGLLTIAGAIFVSVTSEFLPTGLLPEMARDLDTSVARTGLLVSVFAGTVVVATTPLTALTRRLPRKALVVAVLGVIALANLAAAVAPTYGLLVAARVLGGAAHGLFWGVVASYPAYLVAGPRLGRALALTATGASAAFVLGVPAGTALGQWLGWRVAFAVIAAVVVLLAVVVVVFLPSVQRPALGAEAARTPLRQDPSLRRIALMCAIVLAVVIGQFTLYTYMAPWFVEGGIGAETVPLLLFVYGAAGLLGLLLAAVAADRFPTRGLAGMLLGTLAALAVLAVVPASPPLVVAAFVLWGVAFGGVPAMLQTRMLRSASVRTRDLAGALQTTAFNLGIGGGAFVGALLIDGIGLGMLPVAALVLVGLGLGLAVLPVRSEPRLPQGEHAPQAGKPAARTRASRIRSTPTTAARRSSHRS